MVTQKMNIRLIGEASIFYADSKVIGNSRLGDNATIGAGLTVNNEEIPNNTICFLDKNNSRQFKTNKHNKIMRHFQ